MKPSVWLWRLAQLGFAAMLLAIAIPAWAGQAIVLGDGAIPWVVLAALVTVGGAWGDLRTNRRRDREEFIEFKKQIHDEMKELREDLKAVAHRED
jgi:peptidoglycan/LPS O-acetylase OafA/YrhL